MGNLSPSIWYDTWVDFEVKSSPRLAFRSLAGILDHVSHHPQLFNSGDHAINYLGNLTWPSIFASI